MPASHVTANLTATAANGYPGGYCSTDCGAGDTCPANGQCVDFGASGKSCLSKCSKPTDCRNAYYCYDLGGNFGGVCTPKCTANSQCSSANNEICDKNSGQCVVNAAGSTSVTEYGCTQDSGTAWSCRRKVVSAGCLTYSRV